MNAYSHDQASADEAQADVFAAAAARMGVSRLLRHPRLKEAAEALRQNRPDAAKGLLSRYLEAHPDDPGAVRLMAQALFASGQKEQSEGLFARAVALTPDDAGARYEYANVLFQLNKPPLALAELERLLDTDPHNPLCLDVKSIVLSAMGKHSDSLACRRQLAEEHPGSADIQMKYGWAFRSVGQRDPCVAALREAIELHPSFGEAWLSLAGLKGFRFDDRDVAAMQEHLSRPEVAGENRMYLQFALGKALADRKRYAKAFENYARANAIKRLSIDYDPGWLTRHVSKCKALFTPEFLRSRAGAGCDAKDPIFIVGMQRAGSTLLEQILASHPAIEATAELSDICLLAEHIGERIAPEYSSEYPAVLEHLDPDTLRKFGERYLESTRFRRTPGRPFFTDKMPYNFLHVGLIHLILPNARIIDARRHPLGCCFSNFSLNFKFGALFAYRLSELGGAYADYVELMAHFDAALPGRVHRVIYDDLVRDPETEIRRLLDHIGLPFEPACLNFHENTRAMDSASSEQVRRPISADAVDEWRNYEPWLGPLKAALGPVLESWRGAPDPSL
ncbi:MAG TPA: sulfotransferase [Rhizomicrobium sp.]|jgi:tetratricopeptide (TPR) repeat protein